MRDSVLRLRALERLVRRVRQQQLTSNELELLAEELPWLVDEVQRLRRERDEGRDEIRRLQRQLRPRGWGIGW